MNYLLSCAFFVPCSFSAVITVAGWCKHCFLSAVCDFVLMVYWQRNDQDWEKLKHWGIFLKHNVHFIVSYQVSHRIGGLSMNFASKRYPLQDRTTYISAITLVFFTFQLEIPPLQPTLPPSARRCFSGLWVSPVSLGSNPDLCVAGHRGETRHSLLNYMT